MPEISVIIPVFNGEKTILSTLKSALDQTFTDIELIIINDGSSDTSLDLIATVQDPRIKVFSYQNAGISSSRNRGIAHASGDFVAFLDHDDLWTPDKLEWQIAALRNHPEAAVAYSWVRLIDQSDQMIRDYEPVSASGHVLPKLLMHNFLHTASNPLIRKQALIAIGGFDESLFGPEDWDLFLRLAAQYSVVAVPKVQVWFRRVPGSASSHLTRQEEQSLKVIQNVFNQVPSSLQPLKKHSLSNLYMYLTLRALETPKRQNGLLSIRYFLRAISVNPALLNRRTTVLKLLFKAGLLLLLSAKQYAALVTFAKAQFQRYQQAQLTT